MECVDGSLPYKLLLCCPSGISSSQLFVLFDESYNRNPHPDSSLECSICEVWDQRVLQNAFLFNGEKFRYAGHIFYSSSNTIQESSVCLQLGITDYRTFVGTNLNPAWRKFLVASEDDSFSCQHMSNPLGNGAIVVTSDRKILLMQRSEHVGEFPGHVVFPGGHAEPVEVGLGPHFQQENAMRSEAINQKISQEMFDSVIREVVEEIGVPVASLSKPLLIGISRREVNVRPTAFFFIRCSLPSNEVLQVYSNAQDGFESTELLTVSKDALECLAHRMPGCHYGGFNLYKRMVGAAEIV